MTTRTLTVHCIGGRFVKTGGVESMANMGFGSNRLDGYGRLPTVEALPSWSVHRARVGGQEPKIMVGLSSTMIHTLHRHEQRFSSQANVDLMMRSFQSFSCHSLIANIALRTGDFAV